MPIRVNQIDILCAERKIGAGLLWDFQKAHQKECQPRSNVGLLQLSVWLVLRVRSGGIWNGASFQVRPTHVRMRFASVVTGLGMA